MVRQPEASPIRAVPRWPDVVLAAILVGVVPTQPAQAQTTETPNHSGSPTENVTVTAPRPATEAIIKDFVKTYAQPSAALGKLAKWKYGICPATAGLPAQYNTNYHATDKGSGCISCGTVQFA